MDNEELYRAAVHEFYEVYNPLRKKYNLRLHSHFSIYDDGYIEIWQYRGETRTRRVCWVKESDDIEVYKRATEYMRDFERREAKKERATYAEKTEFLKRA